LPLGWECITLSKVISLVSGTDLKPEDYSPSKNEIYKYPIVANGIKNNGIVGFSKSYEINEKTITISGRGTIGFPIIREYEYTPIVRLLVIFPSNYIDIKYLSYSLSLKCNEGVGTSIQQLTVPMIENLAIEIPPQNEQRNISNKIESLFKVIEFC